MKAKALILSAVAVTFGIVAVPISANAATSFDCSKVPAPAVYYQGGSASQVPGGSTITVSDISANNAVTVRGFQIFVGGVAKSLTVSNVNKVSSGSYNISSASDAGKDIYFVESFTCGGANRTVKSSTYKVASEKKFSVVINPELAAKNFGTDALPKYQAVIYRGTWSTTPQNYSYQWYSNGAPIPGATSGTLALTKSLVGTKLRVEMTVSATGFTPFVYSTDVYVPSTVITAVNSLK